jgi:hypothetical protein
MKRLFAFVSVFRFNPKKQVCPTDKHIINSTFCRESEKLKYTAFVALFLISFMAFSQDKQAIPTTLKPVPACGITNYQKYQPITYSQKNDRGNSYLESANIVLQAPTKERPYYFIRFSESTLAKVKNYDAYIEISANGGVSTKLFTIKELQDIWNSRDYTCKKDYGKLIQINPKTTLIPNFKANSSNIIKVKIVLKKKISVAPSNDNSQNKSSNSSEEEQNGMMMMMNDDEAGGGGNASSTSRNPPCR